ncbi:Cof-type HAD-IIB family hydrolase [Ferdinandcohnia quinoae]|uniref:Cof-type HAD-IIB family hydrolase n=1 Tax=Fredinandcohnia quinoae TaxID=2918902 RepID=A0AAW5E814_9BACI|nr:Cof-type HAD-IIB family hydrolase [Fredinandcohnia sp. SECRCQ15]MCH1626157.1 Cof-type HAD-IIB family hydrolase [Fredinandcohnia sp. SECRCQ15]
MITCIATDMDGTLLTGNHVISKENKSAIMAARRQGIEVVVATGRSYLEAKYVLDDAGIECPIICANGAEIRSSNGDVLLSNPIGLGETKEIIRILKDNNIYFELYTDNGTYSDDYDRAITIILDIYMSSSKQSNYEKSLQAAKERFENGLIHLVEDYESVLADQNVKVYKLIAFSFEQEKLQHAKDELVKLTGIAVSSSGSENIEINSIDAQKGNALTAFVKHHNMKIEQAMVIGDNYNDLSMFKVAGRAVAMGNAPEEIKKQCDVVTETNENHGVAKAIMEAIQG